MKEFYTKMCFPFFLLMYFQFLVSGNAAVSGHSSSVSVVVQNASLSSTPPLVAQAKPPLPSKPKPVLSNNFFSPPADGHSATGADVISRSARLAPTPHPQKNLNPSTNGAIPVYVSPKVGRKHKSIHVNYDGDPLASGKS